MKRKVIYISLVAIAAIFTSIAYFSYGFFIKDYEYHGKLNIVAGTLNYEIMSKSLNNSNAITVPKNSTKEIVIDVRSLNDVNSLFELYYNADNTVGVGYVIENIESQPVGQINARELKSIRVKITNTSNANKTVTFGVNGGLVGQTLTLGNLGSSIAIGDVKTAAGLLNPTTQEAIMCDNTNGVLSNCSLYNTIDLALASRNTGTMGLLKDVTRSSTISIPAAKTITLDLNGKTLTCNDSTIFAIVAAGNLTINANGGTIGGTSPSVNAAGSANNVVLNGGTYNNVGAEKTSNLTLNDCELKYVTNTATVDGQTLGNKVIYARKTSNIVVNNIKYNAAASTTFLHLNTAGNITVKNSNIACATNCIYANFSGTLTIEDSTIKSMDTSGSGYVLRENTISATPPSVTIRRSNISHSGNNAIRLTGNSTISIYDSDVFGAKTGIIANYQDGRLPTGTINITDTNITAGQNAVLSQYGSATINIIQQSRPMYITSTATTWKPAIYINPAKDSSEDANELVSNGTINITANKANACTANKSDTTSGLCVYAMGNGANNNNTGNGAVQNSGTSTITINGGTYVAGHVGIDSYADGGSINVRNADVTAGKPLFIDYGGTIKICNSTVTSTLSPTQDLTFNRDNGTGEIKYAKNVTFTSGNNTPTYSGTGTRTNTGNNTCPIS